MPLRPRTTLARQLRQNSTDAEQMFWRALRESGLPWKFRRQHPIGKRLADFACPARKLVIELDGGQHAQTSVDAARDSELEKYGYRVIRFWNNYVLDNIEGVLQTVEAELAKPPPHPNPLRPQGRRGSK